jgi:hypothetical protein
MDFVLIGKDFRKSQMFYTMRLCGCGLCLRRFEPCPSHLLFFVGSFFSTIIVKKIVFIKFSMEEKKQKPHFVKEIEYSPNEPWRTDILMGQEKSESHGHMALSGAEVWYLRDEQGKEIIKDGEEEFKKNYSVRETNLFWSAVLISLVIGIISGLFSGFVVTLMELGRSISNLLFLGILGLLVLLLSVFAFKKIIPVKK